MSNTDKYLYKLYLLCLPLGQLFRFMPDGSSLMLQFSTVIMILAMIRIFLLRKITYGQGVRSFGVLYLFMASYTLIASIILSFYIDSSLVASPLRRCMGDVVLYFLALCSVYYNYYGLSKLVTLEDVKSIFKMQVLILLAVGYLQLGIMFGIGGGLYASLCSIFALREASWLTSLDRGITLFGTEPASSSIICFIVIPFILCSISSNKGGKRLFYVIEFILMAILFLLSNSSSALLSFGFLVVAYLVVYMFHIRAKKLLMIGAFMIGLVVAVLYSLDISTSDGVNSDKESLEYVLVGKIQDKDNMSTAMRASMVINDMKIFYEHTFTGVGDGNQGYFYRKHVPTWALGSEEVQSLMHGTKIANGGGNFFPAFISAYGLIGIIVFLFFLKSYSLSYRQSFIQEDKRFQMIYVLGISLFLLSGWYVVGVKLNESICFLLSLPCVEKMRKKGCCTM